MGRERVLKALNLEEPDRVPLFDFLYEQRSFENVLGRKIAEVTPEVCVEGHKALGLDMMCVSPGPRKGWKNRVEGESMVDEWGIEYKLSPDLITLPWYVKGPISGPESLDGYEMPDPRAAGRLEFVEKVLRIVGEDMAVAASFPIGGPFTAASFLTGFEAFLKYLLAKPRFAQKLLDRVTSYCCEIGSLCVDSGVEIIFLNEDLGHVDGPFVSPTLFRASLRPHIEKLVRRMKGKGAIVLLHSDGNINLLLGDILEMGIQGLHPIERKASMDIGHIKRRFGGSMALIGNVDASSTLQWGTGEDIARQTLECIRSAAPGGGYVLASDHSIHPGIPGQNAKLMFETARHNGAYPYKALPS
ncbi:MAG: hypothetical protein JTT11_09625 [Candidatus Brockarchaeota archaeon]|nr:hypothetical protein [Candidatus Brockarchaeota archaeon]